MTRFLTTAVTAAALFASAPAWACMPPPPNVSRDVYEARAVFVGRVVGVEPTDPAECLSAARARAASGAVMQGDPGERGCEVFGWATLEPVHFIKTDEAIRGPFRVAYNRTPFCAVGWVAEVGNLAIAMVPSDPERLREGATANVEGADQYEPLFRTILDLVEEAQP